MRKVLLLSALLSSCCGACPSCPGWPATPEASARRMGGAYLKSCIDEHGGPEGGGCLYKDQCIDEINGGYCADAGVPLCAQNEDERICS